MLAAAELLDTGSSQLAAVLRYGLAGLRATLAAAQRDHPGDPGQASCQRVLAELDALLDDRQGQQQPAGVQSAQSMAGTAGPRQQATSAAHQLLADAHVPSWFGPALAELAPIELWQRAHLATLRLSTAQAKGWRQALARTLGEAGAGQWYELPFPTDTALVPPVADAPGWCCGPQAPPAADIAQALGCHNPGQSADPHRAELAALATTVAAMAELDAELLLGLESVRFHGLAHLEPVVRQSYRRDLLGRLSAYGQASYGSAESFRALLLVDEALQSLVHLPPAAPGSWWSALRERARALVFRAQADHPGVQVQLLTQPYRNTKNMTGGNDVRIQHDGSGAVLSCLRLWAEVDGRTLPGRVVYAG